MKHMLLTLLLAVATTASASTVTNTTAVSDGYTFSSAVNCIGMQLWNKSNFTCTTTVVRVRSERHIEKVDVVTSWTNREYTMTFNRDSISGPVIAETVMSVTNTVETTTSTLTHMNEIVSPTEIETRENAYVYSPMSFFTGDILKITSVDEDGDVVNDNVDVHILTVK